MEAIGMLTQASYLLIVSAEVDATVEAEWNRWYDDVHLPDALACPGVLGARHFISVGETLQCNRGETHRFNGRVHTAIYELASPEAAHTPEFHRMRGWQRFAPHVRAVTRIVTASRHAPHEL